MRAWLAVLVVALIGSALLVLAALVLATLAPATLVPATLAPATLAPATASTPESSTTVPSPNVAALAEPAGSRLAFAHDFREFRTWERLPVEGAMLPVGVAPGPTAVYVSQRAPEGSRRWPVGTILVKAIEREALEDWVLHAMVKRGVPYNRDGAIGWEFFELALSPDGEPRVLWRGTGPPSGHGYAAQGRDAGVGEVALVCNDCHAAAWQDDGALTPALSLARSRGTSVP